MRCVRVVAAEKVVRRFVRAAGAVCDICGTFYGGPQAKISLRSHKSAVSTQVHREQPVKHTPGERAANSACNGAVGAGGTCLVDAVGV